MSADIEPGSIVVGVDGSPDADRAVRWAAEQARLEGRPLAAVAVAPPPATISSVGWTGVVTGPPAAAHRQARSAATGLVREAMALAHECEPDVVVTAVPVLGDPRSTLLELSEGAHLIVLGSRGRGAVRSALLGSVSGAVSGAALCPVVICRPLGRGEHRGVVVGADGTPESRPVLEFAFRQASLRGQPLTVLHCFWDVVAAVAGLRREAEVPLDDPQLEELRLLLTQSVAGLSEDYPDVQVKIRMQHGLVDEALAPRRELWDLIVVGRHRMTTHGRFLTGSIATAVVERAHSTVAVVPEPGSSPRD